MSESGPSRPSGRGGASSAQKNKYYKRGGFGGQRGGGGRGGSRGDGRGRGGGRGRGRGGGHGDPSWRENGDQYHGAGPSGEGGEKKHHLGRYRDDPLSEVMMTPGICATAIQNKERSAERELIDYLERMADELYPDTGDDIVKAEPGGEDGADFEEMLKRELEGMSVDRKSSRFRLCKHDTPCVIYVNVLPPLDPTRLIVHMLEQIEATGRCPFKYLKRIIPLTGTTHATLPALTTLCPSVLSEGFRSHSDTPLTFGIITNSRNSDRLDRMDMIKAVAEQISALNPAHKVDLKNPERTVLIEVNKNRLGISVVQHYERFRKYNAYQLAEAAAQALATPSVQSPNPEPAGTPAAPVLSKGSFKHGKRDQKAAQMAAAANPKKRKLADVSIDQEDGEIVRSADEFERGEIVDGEEAKRLDGEGLEEIIEGGRVVKMRKEE